MEPDVTDRITNDNQPARGRDDTHAPDPTGQAALLLVESLIHALISRSVITVADAVEIIEVATEVTRDTGPELGDTGATLERSLALLGTIHASLSHDLPR